MRLSVGVATVIRVFLDAGGPIYGYEIMQVTGFPSGKVYPILQRLEEAGWVQAQFEAADPAALGRPLRRMYWLVDADTAAAALDDFARQFSRSLPA